MGNSMSKNLWVHVDTCLSDYWSGHHLPHVGIPVQPGMTADEIKGAIRSEIHADAVIKGEDADYENYLEAVDAMKFLMAEETYFNDVDYSEEDGETVYAYFAYVEIAE